MPVLDLCAIYYDIILEREIILNEILSRLKYVHVFFFKFINFCLEVIYHVHQYFTKKQQKQEIVCQLIIQCNGC